MTMNDHTCTLFINILNDDQTNGNGDIWKQIIVILVYIATPKFVS